MTVEAEVGGKLSVGDLLLKAVVGLQASVDGLSQAMRDKIDNERHYQDRVRGTHWGAKAASVTSGSVFLDLGGPHPGWRWEVRNVVAGGITWATAAQGTADMILQPSQPNGDALIDSFDHFAALPASGGYATGRIVLVNPYKLWVVINNPTDGQQYSAAALFTTYRDGPSPIVSSV
jgi:hypothetical protein